MTGEEKRKQLKEQYKKELKLRKEFLDKAKSLRHSNKINKALTEMTQGMEDDSDDWIARLNQASALTEAKLEMSFDELSEESKKLEALAKEAEMEKLSAKKMLEDMKREMGLLTEEEAPAAEEVKQSEESTEKQEDDKKDDSTPPKKTMGDF